MSPDCPEDLLPQVRAELALSQAALAALLGVHQVTTVGRWERGEIAVRQPRVLCLALERLRRERRMEPPDTLTQLRALEARLDIPALAFVLETSPLTLRRWLSGGLRIWHPRIVALALEEVAHRLGRESWAA
ncbi:MAG: hypothetical protein A2V88_08720 [Elusimicrobia bacterium RBG_16_66_12]|nr:MAG: hypothetical protein A2V88_08720 [Elusimicrobia bacterium RBG_16_66_12]